DRPGRVDSPQPEVGEGAAPGQKPDDKEDDRRREMRQREVAQQGVLRKETDRDAHHEESAGGEAGYAAEEGQPLREEVPFAGGPSRRKDRVRVRAPEPRRLDTRRKCYGIAGRRSRRGHGGSAAEFGVGASAGHQRETSHGPETI